MFNFVQVLLCLLSANRSDPKGEFHLRGNLQNAEYLEKVFRNPLKPNHNVATRGDTKTACWVGLIEENLLEQTIEAEQSRIILLLFVFN